MMVVDKVVVLAGDMSVVDERVVLVGSLLIVGHLAFFSLIWVGWIFDMKALDLLYCSRLLC